MGGVLALNGRFKKVTVSHPSPTHVPHVATHAVSERSERGAACGTCVGEGREQ